MLQHIDTLTTSLSNIGTQLAALVAAQQAATDTAVAAAVNKALADSQAQVDTLVASAQAIEKTLTEAVTAAKG